MEKCVWGVVLSVVLFIQACVVRECIYTENSSCSDRTEAYREFHTYSDDAVKRAVADNLPEQYGGVVLDADEGNSHFNFHVGVYGGHVAVFNWCGSLCRETSVVAGGLSEDVRLLVQKGVYFNDMDDVNKFVEAME